jgi:hypothetical protein
LVKLKELEALEPLRQSEAGGQKKRVDELQEQHKRQLMELRSEIERERDEQRALVERAVKARDEKEQWLAMSVRMLQAELAGKEQQLAETERHLAQSELERANLKSMTDRSVFDKFTPSKVAERERQWASERKRLEIEIIDLRRQLMSVVEPPRWTKPAVTDAEWKQAQHQLQRLREQLEEHSSSASSAIRRSYVVCLIGFLLAFMLFSSPAEMLDQMHFFT